MALGTNHMDVTTGNVFRPDIWSRELTRATEATLVLADKVSRFDQDVMSKGKSIYIPNLSNLNALDKVANTAVTLQSPTETSINLLVNKHKYCAFLIEDILAAQSQYSLMSEYTQKGGYAIRKAIDTDIANLATGFSISAGTFNTTITTTATLTAVQALDDGDVPQSDRVWILKPHAVNDLRTISDYTRYDGTGFAGSASTGFIGSDKGGVRPNGLVGMLYNAPVYMTTQVYQTGNNISNMYMHKEAIACAIQKNPRVQSDNRIDFLGTLVVADTLYGVLERRDSFGVEFRN
jgi:hypothetical protein